MQLPARIGKYELEEFLGGGMSHVYRARDTVIGRTVAVKILTEQGCADQDTKTRFLAEARMAGNIQHENVINIYDFGEDEQHRPFMVMEFLRGEDLRKAIKSSHTGDLREKLRIALQIARAIGYVHSLKIVHRDIKPENIHITPTGVVKLMDFGIAKTEGLSMTRTGYVMGTPYYMAPEQVLGKNIGELVDIYAFGVLFFELLAGVRPITGDTVERIFYAILNEPLNLEPLQQLNVPEPVRDLVARCTAKDPAQRPQTFELVAVEIERFLAGMETPRTAAATAVVTPSHAPPPAVPAEEPSQPAHAKPWMAIALGGALLAAVAVLAVIVLNKPKHPDTAATPPVDAVAHTAPASLPTEIDTDTGKMVLVPHGDFLFGKDKIKKQLPDYYIDQTEVTNAAYQKFCDAVGRPLPKNFPKDKPDYPVVYVTIDDAKAFAAWAHKSLPNSMEWEKAARGADGRLFPWGNQSEPSLANLRDNPTQAKHEILPVTAFESGASPFKALQMVGNVWEFVDETDVPLPALKQEFAGELKPPPGPTELWYMTRGESFDEPLAPNVLWDSSLVPARWKDGKIGFRCVREPSTASSR